MFACDGAGRRIVRIKLSQSCARRARPAPCSPSPHSLCLLSAGGQNSFFRIIRGVNNMRFEEECIFATFDVTELLRVLQGKSRGGMFGIVDEKPPRTTEVRWNDTKAAAGHKKGKDEEDDDEQDEVRRARKHHGHSKEGM